MLVRPTWKGASRTDHCALIRSHHQTGMTASGLAQSISLTTGERVRRQEITATYRRFPILESTHPLEGVKRIRLNGSVDDDAPTMEPVHVRIVGFTEDEAAAYDAEAPGVTVLAVTDRECRWPVRPGLFCGHHATGRYCDHHSIRARGTEL